MTHASVVSGIPGLPTFTLVSPADLDETLHVIKAGVTWRFNWVFPWLPGIEPCCSYKSHSMPYVAPGA